MATATVRTARAGCAAVLLLALGTAAMSGRVPWPLLVLAFCALVGGAWRPAAALPWVLAVVPWGERLAGVPVRASEAVLWAFLAGWCLRLFETRRKGTEPVFTLLWPPVLFGAVVVLSWVRVALERTASPDPWARALAAVRLVPADYLVTAGRDPHTAAALQLLLAVAVFLSLAHLIRRDPTVSRRVLAACALSGVAAALASIVAVPVIYFTTGDWNEIDRYISVTRSRGAFHLRDVNAAGSHYILAGLIAFGLTSVETGSPRCARLAFARLLWRAGQCALVVALWMSGSRAAMAAGALGVATWVAAHWWAARGRGFARVSPRALGAAALVVLVALTASARLGSDTATSGSASRSLGIRAQFLETSLRMFATAPVLGVGVGTYYQRSNAFMPPGIRAIYGHENAHNYFMQVGAELGLAGLVLFLWWLAAALREHWSATLAGGASSLAWATCLACVGYLLTCVTGHPFLVVEASVPFWAALAAGATPPRDVSDAAAPRG